MYICISNNEYVHQSTEEKNCIEKKKRHETVTEADKIRNKPTHHKLGTLGWKIHSVVSPHGIPGWIPAMNFSKWNTPRDEKLPRLTYRRRWDSSEVGSSANWGSVAFEIVIFGLDKSSDLGGAMACLRWTMLPPY